MDCTSSFNQLLKLAAPPFPYPPIPNKLGSKPHDFFNVDIPALESIWTVPASAQSPVGRFQVTVRDKNGSDVLVRVTQLNSTQFKITSPIPINSVTIFANPIETSSS